MIIDGHCHIGEGLRQTLTTDELICQMDQNRVDRAVVCPFDRYLTVFNREGNELVSAAVKRYPDRLIGFASVNPWFGQTAKVELQRALQSGLVGLKFNPSLQGFFINDRIVMDLLEVAAEFQAPVYFHTGTPVHALPLQLADLALLFPSVKFIMGHTGASDFSGEALAALKTAPNIYAEISKQTNFDLLREVLVSYGPERMIFGTDFPVYPLALELEKIKLLNPEQREKEWIMGQTLLSLLPPKTKGGNS